MSVTGAAVAATSPLKAVYSSEVRFGVVMYGGVSLAIYINGVANELFEMACATPKDAEEECVGTREVYRKASWLRSSEDLRRRYTRYLNDPANTQNPFDSPASLPTGQRTRFIVDVISGTSAGGINGAFLAKALVNGQDFSPLKKLWIQEGNIETLLNDEASYKDIARAGSDRPPRSLLNSDRMYIKLLEAFQDMKTVLPPIDGAESRLVDEIDLYMTTTDIRGALVPLRLFDEVVYEKRFRQFYHFRYPALDNSGPWNAPFADRNAPFLAFAARCTSSFPFAFEPMTVADAQRLCAAMRVKGDIDPESWKPFFTGLSDDDKSGDDWRDRAFGDGGYLDNKPFSYVVDALSWRLGGLPMERKLIYVEPAPSHPENEPQDPSKKPDAIENAIAALLTIPRQETIREDLEVILARNRRIERVERIVRQVEADTEDSNADWFKPIKFKDGKLVEWNSLDTNSMIDSYGVAFLPYRRLRIAAVTDDIAERLAVWWGIDRRSDRLYALKAMVSVWREEKYYETEIEKTATRTAPVNTFLHDFDLKYRLRRVAFLLRKVHELHSLVIKVKMGTDDHLSDIEKRLKERLARRQPLLLSKDELDPVIAALQRLAIGLGAALKKLRVAAWMPVPQDKHAIESRAASRAELVGLLRILLNEPLAESDPASWEKISLPAELPLPSALRTLEENVFIRAKALFVAGQRAKIEELLVTDWNTLKEAYEKVMHSSDRKVAFDRDLLGNPEVVVTDVATRRVDFRLGEVTVPDNAAPLNTPKGKMLREFLAEYFLRFDEYDQMSFPLYYDTGTGEPSTVEVLRVSPEDARDLIDERRDQGNAGHQRQKLAGTTLFNFGAFLEERWRRNDIMWGRLDGCERLLKAMFPATEDSALRKGLLQEAQRAIVREEMQPEGYDALVRKFAKTLAQYREATLKEAFGEMWPQLAETEKLRDARMADVLEAILGDAGMVKYVREYYEVDRTFDTPATTKIGARALTVTGRILEGIEKHYRTEGPLRMVWITRGGRALQVLLAISSPDDLSNAFLRHWLGLVYIFEFFIVVSAIVFSAPAARTFGLTAFCATAALHLGSLVIGDLMSGKWRWVNRFKILVRAIAVLLLLLALLGAWAWYNGSLGTIICAGVDDADWFVRPCHWRS